MLCFLIASSDDVPLKPSFSSLDSFNVQRNSDISGSPYVVGNRFGAGDKPAFVFPICNANRNQVLRKAGYKALHQVGAELCWTYTISVKQHQQASIGPTLAENDFRIAFQFSGSIHKRTPMRPVRRHYLRVNKSVTTRDDAINQRPERRFFSFTFNYCCENWRHIATPKRQQNLLVTSGSALSALAFVGATALPALPSVLAATPDYFL